MDITPTTNTGINGFTSFTGDTAIGALSGLNLALSTSAVIIQTSTQTLTFTTSVTQTGGTLSYYGDPNPQTYMQATRIA